MLWMIRICLMMVEGISISISISIRISIRTTRFGSTIRFGSGSSAERSQRPHIAIIPQGTGTTPCRTVGFGSDGGGQRA
jgi:hypothetical protein